MYPPTVANASHKVPRVKKNSGDTVLANCVACPLSKTYFCASVYVPSTAPAALTRRVTPADKSLCVTSVIVQSLAASLPANVPICHVAVPMYGTSGEIGESKLLKYLTPTD